MEREILGDIDKVLGLAKTMTWKGCRPVVQMIEKAYNKGVCLTKSGMKMIEDKIIRINLKNGLLISHVILIEMGDFILILCLTI